MPGERTDVGKSKPLGTHQALTPSRVRRKGQEITYDIGVIVSCLSKFDSNPHDAEVVDKRADVNGEYFYVHYIDQDKRMDEWIGADRIRGVSNRKGPADDDQTEDQKLTRRAKRKFHEVHPNQDLHERQGIDQQLEQAHQEKTKVKNIQSVILGRYEISAWYFSPYPEEFTHLDKLYVCEFCLKYFRKMSTFVRHMDKCKEKHPPGDEIYRSLAAKPGQQVDPERGITDPVVSVFEVDGSKHKIYCQSLCLLSKLFLDHKTLYYDVDQFLFYILCEEINGSYHIVGYFSKEKHSTADNNLACILVLPPHQKKGYGTFQMQFSYELSKKEGKAGGPERPLSDLGAVAYRGLWQRALVNALDGHRQTSIKDLVELTGIKKEDVEQTLREMKLAHYYKGMWTVISLPDKDIAAIQEKIRKPLLGIDNSRLHWQPFSQQIVQAEPKR